MKNLLDNISSKIHLSEELKERIVNLFEKQVLEPKQYLMQAGQNCKKIYFLEKGIIRTFYHDDNGKDISSWFYKEDQFFTSWYSLYYKVASFEFIQSLSDAEVYAIDYNDYEQLMKEFPEFERFGRLLSQEHLAFLDYYFKGYLFMSAKEKYQLLIDYFPDIELHVKLGDIASYLGISQETFSRIRNQK